MKKVYKSGIFVSNYLNWNKIECSKDNKMKSIEEINDDIYQLVKK